MSASIQIFVGAWMYNFLLLENSVSSELLESLLVDLLNQKPVLLHLILK